MPSCYRRAEYCTNALRGQTIHGESGPLICTYNNGWRFE